MFKLNEIYHGFRLNEETEIKEVSSIARVFEHVKSGARLLHLGNSDTNKMFCISFRTPPADDTGVPHILEHSVLCGSRKFKSKSVFTDIMKGSLTTFLNASTFPDKTIYPISSRNTKDFFNLMDVYLDAVLHPTIYDNHELLRQEGWRYEFDEKDNLILRGVVFSEMKGALSTPELVLGYKINKALYPDTPYSFNSGGDPRYIKNLTQEKFEDFHARYYHPSNSYIYLYGDQNLEECLKFIDEEYLREFDRLEISSEIPDARPFEELQEVVEEYSISDEQEEKNRAYLALAFSCGEAKDPEIYLPMKILYHMLIKSSASPLKKALLEAGIGEMLIPYNILDIEYGKKNIFVVAVNNTDKTRKEEFKKITFDTLTSLVKDGIDKNLLEAAINSLSFELSEADPWKVYNKGLGYSFRVMDSWLYDGDPLVHLRYEERLKAIKDKIDTGYFEDIIDKYLLRNNHCALVVLEPKNGLADIYEKELAEELKCYKASLSEKEIEELKAKNAKLKEVHLAENTKEETATLPKLALSDVSKDAEVIMQRVKEFDGVTILSNNIAANKIAYISLLFDTSCIEEEYIPYLGLLSDILGQVDTKYKSYLDLSTEISRKTGGISFSTQVYSDVKELSIYHPKFIVSSKVFIENIDALFELINEIITESSFEYKARLKDIIYERKAILRRRITRSDSFGINRVASYYSVANAYIEKLSGIGYYEFLCSLLENFDEKYEEVQAILTKVYSKLFNKNNLILSYTGEEQFLDKVEGSFLIVSNNLKAEKLEPVKLSFESSKVVEGLVTSSNVQFVIKGFNCNKLGFSYSGKMRVLQNILSSEYLHPRVRMQGGAYGCYIDTYYNGNISFSSYRDPNLVETIKTYDEAFEFIENFECSEEEMASFIIGAIGEVDQLLNAEVLGERATRNYIAGISNDYIQRERLKILSTSLEDINALSKMIEQGMDANYCCVLGNVAKLGENREVFDSIRNLL